MPEVLSPVVIGDTYLSETWAVVVGGAPIDLADPDSGWTVRATAKHPRLGYAVIDWADTGAAILVGRATVEVGAVTVTTSTVRLHLAPSRTAVVSPETALDLAVVIEHPTRGAGGQPYRATVVGQPLLVLAESTGRKW